MDALMLDGNAVAGLLQEVFAVDMTMAVGTCANCHSAGPVGAMHVFQGAGTVLSCPDCGDTLMKIVKDGARLWFGFPGVQTLEVST
jgi:uncharacterized protein DUF6510